MDVYGRNPKNKTGEYFRSNVWSYRPIHWLCYLSTIRHEKETGYGDLIPLKTLQGMEFNDGKGLRSERKCKLLSDYIQEVVDYFFQKEVIPFEISPFPNESFKWGVNKDGELYIDYGDLYVDKGGKLIREKEVKDLNIEKISPHRIKKEHLQEFCDFLKNCGGFEVW